MPPQSETLGPIQSAVLHWYEEHRRDLPWRKTRDPYAILVSEVMLQQTQVDRVIPKYVQFLERFPDFSTLAVAPVAEVIRVWSPLGYNLRAVRLHGIARQVVECYGGRLPQDVASLQQLKGLGPYTAAAVACFAFGRQTPVVDTNVRRVLGRALLGEARPAPKALDKAAAGGLPIGYASEWSQALMDIGSMLCSTRQPRCLLCPVQPWCVWASSLSLAEVSPPAKALAERVAAYRTQPPFKGSSRYYRGRIVEALRRVTDNNGLQLMALGETIRDGFGEAELPWLEGLVQGLERDGLVKREGATIRLP